MSTRAQALWDAIQRTATRDRLCVSGIAHTTATTVCLGLLPSARSKLQYELHYASRNAVRERVRECLASIDEIEMLLRAEK